MRSPVFADTIRQTFEAAGSRPRLALAGTPPAEWLLQALGRQPEARWAAAVWRWRSAGAARWFAPKEATL